MLVIKAVRRAMEYETHSLNLTILDLIKLNSLIINIVII